MCNVLENAFRFDRLFFLLEEERRNSLLVTQNFDEERDEGEGESRMLPTRGGEVPFPVPISAFLPHFQPFDGCYIRASGPGG
jgi:hypothetical protein